MPATSAPTPAKPIPLWSVISPGLCLVVVVVAAVTHTSPVLAVLLGGGLIAAVMAAVHHAEVVAHRIGEPFGSLVLALAVTLIEVALIITLMISGGDEATSLVRDTVFATIMIIINGLLGLCLLIGGRRFGEQSFGIHGVSATLATLAAMASLTLVLPNYTTTVPGPFYSHAQLAFVAAVSLILYATFVFVQTVRHRDYFLPVADGDEDSHAPPPSNRVALLSALLLFACLAGVIVAAEMLAPTVEHAVHAAGAPKAVVGIIIASIVLMPEGYAAVRAARRNRLQTSLNLTLGSALASIGLTIPAVAIISLLAGWTLSLGLGVKETVLLVLSFFVATLSLNTGRTTVLQGMVHLVIFAVYLFTALIP